MCLYSYLKEAGLHERARAAKKRSGVNIVDFLAPKNGHRTHKENAAFDSFLFDAWDHGFSLSRLSSDVGIGIAMVSERVRRHGAACGLVDGLPKGRKSVRENCESPIHRNWRGAFRGARPTDRGERTSKTSTQRAATAAVEGE